MGRVETAQQLDFLVLPEKQNTTVLLPEINWNTSELRNRGIERLGFDLIMMAQGPNLEPHVLFALHEKTGKYSHYKGTLQADKDGNIESLARAVTREFQEEAEMDLSQIPLFAVSDKLILMTDTHAHKQGRKIDYRASVLTVWTHYNILNKLADECSATEEVRKAEIWSLSDIRKAHPDKLRECTQRIYDELEAGGYMYNDVRVLRPLDLPGSFLAHDNNGAFVDLDLK